MAEDRDPDPGGGEDAVASLAHEPRHQHLRAVGEARRRDPDDEHGNAGAARPDARLPAGPQRSRRGPPPSIASRPRASSPGADASAGGVSRPLRGDPRQRRLAPTLTASARIVVLKRKDRMVWARTSRRMLWPVIITSEVCAAAPRFAAK